MRITDINPHTIALINPRSFTLFGFALDVVYAYWLYCAALFVTVTVTCAAAPEKVCRVLWAGCGKGKATLIRVSHPPSCTLLASLSLDGRGTPRPL